MKYNKEILQTRLLLQKENTSWMYIKKVGKRTIRWSLLQQFPDLLALSSKKSS